MKKVILPLLAFVCLVQNVFAQTSACSVYSFTLEFISAAPSATPGKTDIRVNISWESSANSGNKFTYFNIWQADQYVAFNYTNPSNPPKNANLSTALGTVIIKDPSATPILFSTYNPDQAYQKVLGLSGASIKRTVVSSSVDRFTVYNLLLPGITTNANNKYDFKGDIWSSQQNSGMNVQCSVQGSSFVLNDVVDRSSITCSQPTSTLNVKIQSSNKSISGTYQVYADDNTPGMFDEATDTKVGDLQSFTTSSTINVAGAWPYDFTGSNMSIPVAYQGKNLWIVIYPTGVSKQVFPIANGCAPLSVLPVTFAGFTANRENHNVRVRWQTAQEANVAGFQVQRLTSGNWQMVSYLPAKNNASGNVYEITDANSYSGISQYRIVAVDNDGKQKMSEIRSVRGEGSLGKISVFPNPSTNGRFNIVFDNSRQRDINIVDMSGRIVKQLRGETSISVSLELLQDGLYQVQVTDLSTGERSSEKVIIKKR